MISGKPFVASRVPGLTTVVEGAGILFPEGDHEALATELRLLITDDLHYQNVARLCQERAKNYGIDQTVEKHIALYHRLWESQN